MHFSEVRPRSRHLDADLSMRMHVKKTVSCCFAAFRQLRQIRRYVPTSTFQKLVVALVHSRLDYGNGVLVGTCPPNALTPVCSECSGTVDLQSETLRPHHRRTRQPSLAAGPGAHTVFAVLSYKVLHDTAPRYLGPLTRIADIPLVDSRFGINTVVVPAPIENFLFQRSFIY